MAKVRDKEKKKEAPVSRNRETIFKAAMELFLAKGYDAATTNDICEAAKITKPTLYYYAKSKRHLFYLLHMEAIERDLIPHIEKMSAIGDPLERLMRMIEGFVEMICTHPELRVLLHETLAIRDTYFKEVRQMWKKHYYLLRDTLAELQRAGTIKNTSKPSRLALLVLGMLAWITFWFDYNRKDQINEIAATAVEFVFGGLYITEPRP